jgi:membrane protease subunit HflC
VTKRIIIIIVGAVFAIALLSRAMTYTVRFTEAAVLTHFGRAGEGAEKTTPGLKFKWPDPIESVTKYDKRARFLLQKSQTQQTADSKQLEVESYCTWRVKDPLKFFQRFSNAGDRAADHYKKAEDVLRGNLRSAVGEISKYRLNELFSTDTKATKLNELEGRILTNLKAAPQEQQGGGSLDDYGIEVVTVGINRIVLPDETTKAVFESMKADRKRLVTDLESRGISQAQAITSKAQQNASRIESFAKSLAEEIRKKGDEEALPYVAQMKEAPELAVFLKNMDLIRDSMAKRITLVFSTSMPGMELFSPSAMTSTRKNGVPGVSSMIDATNQPAIATQPQPNESPKTVASDETKKNGAPR